jgi:DNA-binding transcriptional regulator YdaS (Cro superfamily)
MSLPFSAWVDRYGGAGVLAAKLNVHPATVRVWLRGEGAPEAEKIAAILKLSKDELTFQMIYREATRSKK